jgi:hypothetical protein
MPCRFTRRQLFNVVADMRSYPSFVPYCKATGVVSPPRPLNNDPATTVEESSMTVGFLSFTESYTSRVTAKRFESVEVRAILPLRSYRCLSTLYRPSHSRARRCSNRSKPPGALRPPRRTRRTSRRAACRPVRRRRRHRRQRRPIRTHHLPQTIPTRARRSSRSTSCTHSRTRCTRVLARPSSAR